MASGDGYSVSTILVFGTPTNLYIDLNIPICGFTLALVVLFLNLRAPSGSFVTKLKKIDIVYESQRSKLTLLTFTQRKYPGCCIDHVCDDWADVGWRAIRVVFCSDSHESHLGMRWLGAVFVVRVYRRN
jgi:hypothetical protein